MLMKLLGACCAVAATSTVLVYGFGLQVQRPITPLQAKQEAPLTTPKVQVVASAAPIHAPEEVVAPPQKTAPQVAQDPDPLPEKTLKAAAASEIRIADEPAERPELETEQVFVFWQPFRSRSSAQGFAQGLSARAEVPISVISEETDTGRYYRVVLPYAGEAQRLERLAKLESTTRLEMGE